MEDPLAGVYDDFRDPSSGLAGPRPGLTQRHARNRESQNPGNADPATRCAPRESVWDRGEAEPGDRQERLRGSGVRRLSAALA